MCASEHCGVTPRNLWWGWHSSPWTSWYKMPTSFGSCPSCLWSIPRKLGEQVAATVPSIDCSAPLLGHEQVSEAHLSRFLQQSWACLSLQCADVKPLEHESGTGESLRLAKDFVGQRFLWNPCLRGLFGHRMLPQTHRMLWRRIPMTHASHELEVLVRLSVHSHYHF